jgi:hypothetical protein
LKVKLHIERLVLEGLPITHADGPAVQAALEAELSRLLTQRALGLGLATGGAVPSVPAENIRLNGGSPAQIGGQIASSVYRGMIR